MSATTEQLTGLIPSMRRSSMALDNLRAFVILLVLSFHSVLAYLQFLPAAPYPFDSPPYQWRAIPIIDSHRLLGFDLYCAWQDVFLMSLFFFVGTVRLAEPEPEGGRKFPQWPSVAVGLPFVLVVALIDAGDALSDLSADGERYGPSPAHWRHWLALPFWPCGPMWFLWLLLVGDFGAAALHRFAPASGSFLVRLLRPPKPIRPDFCGFCLRLDTGLCALGPPVHALGLVPAGGPSRSSSAARCTTPSIFLPVSASEPAASNAAFSQLTDRWCGGGSNGLLPPWCRCALGWVSPA